MSQRFLKKGDTSLPSNYRPISLISCVGKVMERIIYKHVYNQAFEKSQKTKQHSSFFSREFKIVLYSSINWWTEECLGKKTD
jgi:hypothetical protein